MPHFDSTNSTVTIMGLLTESLVLSSIKKEFTGDPSLAILDNYIYP